MPRLSSALIMGLAGTLGTPHTAAAEKATGPNMNGDYVISATPGAPDQSGKVSVSVSVSVSESVSEPTNNTQWAPMAAQWRLAGVHSTAREATTPLPPPLSRCQPASVCPDVWRMVVGGG